MIKLVNDELDRHREAQRKQSRRANLMIVGFCFSVLFIFGVIYWLMPNEFLPWVDNWYFWPEALVFIRGIALGAFMVAIFWLIHLFIIGGKTSMYRTLLFRAQSIVKSQYLSEHDLKELTRICGHIDPEGTDK